MITGINFKTEENLRLLKEHVQKFAGTSGVSLDELSWVYPILENSEGYDNLVVDTEGISWSETVELIQANKDFLILLELIKGSEDQEFMGLHCEFEHDMWTFKVMECQESPELAKAGCTISEEYKDCLSDFITSGFEALLYEEPDITVKRVAAMKLADKLWGAPMQQELLKCLQAADVVDEKSEEVLKIQSITLLEVDEEHGEGYNSEADTISGDGSFVVEGTCLDTTGAVKYFQYTGLGINYEIKSGAYINFECNSEIDIKIIPSPIEREEAKQARVKNAMRNAASNNSILHDLELFDE